ncbi:MAG: TRASH domain-containing protein [Candidatus Thermoplasmatota archaeon]|nr:TRASH domain-containing protein [Candidatus Thermoplasmatota archaeon]MCL5955472.1 TRASH domain-containing protein [Candidatus Thermoplasmatota archaeon]
MKRNLSELEQRLVTILREDSRKTISEIALELDVSRTTARKTLDSLMGSGRIKSFTVNLSDDEKDLAVIQVEDVSLIPKKFILEDFELIDSSHMVVIHYENLLNLGETRIIDVKIAKRRTIGENPGRMLHLHCDLCGSDIQSDPITVRSKGKTYYACCPGCESTLRKRIAVVELQD